MILIRLKNISVKGTRLIKSNWSLVQAATITSRSTRGEPIKLEEPFPYEEKKFRWYHKFFDSTIVRLSHENSKVIVVEGTIGAGKSAFCQALAEEFEMKYFPQPNVDDWYILPNGYDLKQHNDEMPEHIRIYNYKNFCVNPYTFRAALLQVNSFYLKFYQYVDAMCHLYNTGQGVILERSFHSDYVFMKALVENKYVSSEYLQPYFTIKKNVSCFFPKPHLIIYLDMPVPVVQERIKTRNYSYEQNSPALTPQYLASLEKIMKKDYLINARKESEILIYEWSDGGNVNVVIDDIENIDFDIMRGDRRFLSWRIGRSQLYNYRCLVTNSPYSFDDYFYYPWHNLEEIHNLGIENLAWSDLFHKLPEGKYDLGYNYLIGDSKFKILFNTSPEKHRKPRFFF